VRADRLLSELLLLQSRGKMTAQELAKELEVSERTIYRDMDALSRAGVPVYGEPGLEGGYALLDSFRTDLTGLTEGELSALFMLNVPSPLVDLGVSQELRAALVKLSAALPHGGRRSESWVRQRFHLDYNWWPQDQERVPHLRAIHRAVWQDRLLHMAYRPPYAATIERKVAPYGLVAKAGIWYLVCAVEQKIQVRRVSELMNVRVLDSTFVRPPGFDLTAFWEKWCADSALLLTDYEATVRVSPRLVPELSRYFGDAVNVKVKQAGPPDGDGWITLALSFESLEAARERILGFGGGVQVLAPPALRRSVIDYAEQILGRYVDQISCVHESISLMMYGEPS
jgi:predicted DNA-binding transcriptional regulator YafY